MGVPSGREQNAEESVRAAVKYLGLTAQSFTAIPEPERTNFVLASYNSGIGHVLDAMALAMYMAEVTLMLSPSGKEGETLLRLMLNSLYLLSEKKALPRKIKAIYELRAVSEAGFMPNLLCCRDGFAVINFEKYLPDNPVRDLYLFLRKLLEKNAWSSSIALSIMTAYETQRTLSDQDRKQLYYRFAYPEKFWKIVNFYYNSGKAWIPGRNREKLENLLRQEPEKKAFLDSVLK